MSHGGLLLCLLPFPLQGINGFCASKGEFLKNSHHSLDPLSSMEASHRIPPNWPLSELKFALLKSRTLVLGLTFNTLSRIPNSTILWSLQPIISLTEILQSRLSRFVNSKSSSASFLVGTSNICIRKQSSVHSRDLTRQLPYCSSSRCLGS